MSDIVRKAHELKSRLSLANALCDKIMRRLELLADYWICFLANLGCEDKRLGHIQPVDLDYLRTIGSVDDFYNANEFWNVVHTSVPAACAQTCAKLK